MEDEYDNDFGHHQPLPLFIALALIFALLILTALGGNALVCAAVYWDRHLRRQPENLFLISLAVSDLLVSILVMVFAAVNDLLGYWSFGSVYCKLWMCFDVMCCSASILNLCAIAFDRYWHISKPMVYVRYMNRRRIFYVIVLVWLMSAVIGFSQIIISKANNATSPTVANDSHCVLELDLRYAIISSALSFFVPAAIMVLLYTRLYLYARQHVRSIRSQLKQTTGLLIMQLATENIRIATAASMGAGRLSVPSPQDGTSTCPSPLITTPRRSRSPNFLSSSATRSNGKSSTAANMIKRGGSMRDPADVSDQKARNTLGVIMGTFLICWLPFFCINVARPLLVDVVDIPHWLFQWVTWLGYANSTANPVIYSIFNRDFRRAFQRILLALCQCCRRDKDDEMLRSTSRACDHVRYSHNSHSESIAEVHGTRLLNANDSVYYEKKVSITPSVTPAPL
uniref:G-protein coupled receptors family 1 profile domain-containing protein n=1 Tax=Plectus sambesii TaxID=2011161 RepID=A0A914XRC0_9BILA